MTIIFDFDGTICDSFDKAVEIANVYLNKYHLSPITARELRERGMKDLFGKRKLNLWQKLFFVRMARRESSKYIGEFRPFPGIPEILKKLSKKNKLQILSSNSRENIEKFLKLNNLENIFLGIHTNSNLFGKEKTLRKLKPDYYIGDEPRDVDAAKKAEVTSIAVTWGYTSKNLLKKHKPDFLLTRPTELLSMEKLLKH